MPKIDRRRKAREKSCELYRFPRAARRLHGSGLGQPRAAPCDAAGWPGRVVISEEEFDGWMETLHLLRSPANARRLLASIICQCRELDERDLIEPQE